MNPLSQATIDLVKAAQASMDPNQIAKAYTVAGGLVNYDLQAPALKLFPVLAPLRNIVPRVAGNGGTATNWRAVTAINTGNFSPGVSEANRSGFMTSTFATYVATYKGIGLEDYVSFEADYASAGFDDLKAKAVANLLSALMIEEERVILGGNSSTPLGTANTPTVATSTTGGAIATATAVYVRVVGLTLDGYRRASVSAGLPGQLTRTNADATSDNMGGGNGIISAAGNQTTGAGSTNSVQGSVTPKPGEVAWAWFWGASAAAATLGAITTVNSINITTAAGTGSQVATDAKVTTDYSQNTLIYDGLLSQVFGTGAYTAWQTLGGVTMQTTNSGAIVGNLATGTPGTGSTLTSDGAGGVVEIDAMLRAYWDQFRMSPTRIICHAQEATNINKKILAGTTGSLVRFNTDWATPTDAPGVGGTGTRAYYNKYTGQLIQIMIHPYAVPGTVLFYSDSIPYPLSGVGNVIQIKTRRDYYQLEWPVTKRRYEYGVYADEVLQNYAPFAFAILQNIQNG